MAIGSRNTRIALICIWIAAGMVGLSYAAVPLYRLFCQVTGYGGTTQRAEAAPGEILAREMTVRFDSNAQPALPWEFRPMQSTQSVHIGEVALAHFKVKNDSSVPVTGIASFNVLPVDTGQYFKKLYCFCFNEQTLQPGEEKDLPVSYFIDPSIAKEPRFDTLKTITLSYTFFKSDDVTVDKGKGGARLSGTLQSQIPQGNE